jgi:hypothetical protein
MSGVIDLTGKRFGRWRVIRYARDRRWFCVCDCGTRRAVCGKSLRNGGSRSCGCLRRELLTKHGLWGRKEYWAWYHAKQRCLDPNHPRFPDYGGRGIWFYGDWQPSVGAFLADAGTCPPGCSLDRIDNDRGYEPGNVRWTDRKTQNRNRRPRRPSTAVKRRRPERELPPLDDVPF